jgi:hypothetical protein
MPDTASTPDIKEVVKEKYGQAALRVKNGGSTCCGATPASDSCCDPITTNLYDAAQASQIPQEALLASLGCGNPTALAQLHAGEVVLDLGSGGGIDVLLSARRVGPTGKAYGLDMTDEMLALANQNKRTSGLTNVEFLKGEIENIPLPDNSVDVIISPPTKTASCAKPSACSNPADASPSLMSSRAAKSLLPFGKAFCSGWDASQALWKKTNIAQNSRLPASNKSMWNPPASTASTTPANSSLAKAWT